MICFSTQAICWNVRPYCFLPFSSDSIWNRIMVPASRFPTRLTAVPILITILVTALLTVSACAIKKPGDSTRLARIDLSLLHTLPDEQISYEGRVRPVLERCCVVCHGCYDAPCQLKLSSPEGVSPRCQQGESLRRRTLHQHVSGTALRRRENPWGLAQQGLP